MPQLLFLPLNRDEYYPAFAAPLLLVNAFSAALLALEAASGEAAPAEALKGRSRRRSARAPVGSLSGGLNPAQISDRIAAIMLYAERHLVLVNRPGWQRIGDFEAIKAKIEAKAPEIEVFIVTTEARHSVQRKKASKRPTLIVSPSPLGDFEPERGKVLRGRTISKDMQLARLRELGISVPMTDILTPETSSIPPFGGRCFC